MSLRDRIVAEIRQHGPIPFSRYMELCLYEPELGYYSRAQDVFGKAGDFYTASDVHAVFGRLMARQFHEIWQAMDRPALIEVVELGPGRGLFAADVLAWATKKFPEFGEALRYRLVEASAGSRRKLETRFEGEIKSGRVSVAASLDEVPGAENVIVFGNEFFDALPIEIVDVRGQVFVSEREGRFVEEFAAVSARVEAFLDSYAVQPSQEQPRVEAPLLAQEYMTAVATCVRRGCAMFFDYGYTRRELLAGRRADTVRAFREHSVSGNVYEAPGEQDITANVNWTALQDAAATGGLQPLGLLTQSAFLMGVGEANQFADALEDTVTPQERAKVMLQLKHLVTPVGMGEMFQVLVMGRGIDAPLSGLKFAT